MVRMVEIVILYNHGHIKSAGDESHWCDIKHMHMLGTCLQFRVSRDIGVLQRRLHYSLREVIIGGGHVSARLDPCQKMCWSFVCQAWGDVFFCGLRDLILARRCAVHVSAKLGDDVFFCRPVSARPPTHASRCVCPNTGLSHVSRCEPKK
eukprot:1145561-Pelagomonas_calceolata.AAC.11